MNSPPSRAAGLLLLALLALAGGVFFASRSGGDAAPVGAAPADPAGARPEPVAPVADSSGVTAHQRTAAAAADGAPSGTDPATGGELLLSFYACSHAPTSVTLASLGTKEPARRVDARTWSVPWPAARRADARVEVEFGANVRLILTGIRARELDVAMPALAELTATLRGAHAGWAVDWTPETAEGARLAEIVTPFALSGASASLHLAAGGSRAGPGSEALATLAPVGSTWTVYAAAPGLRVEDPARNHVEVPATLTFDARPQHGVLVLGPLPEDTLLLVYTATDASTPLLQARVLSARPGATTVESRGAPLAAHAAHHLACLLPDGRRASVAFETDSVGAAEVSAYGLRFDPPTLVSMGAEHELRHLYLRMDGSWQAVPSDAGDFHRERGALALPGAVSGEIRVVHPPAAWDEGYLVTTAGAVARLRPVGSGPVVPEWLPGDPAQLSTESLPNPEATVAWRLSFLALDGAGEEHWLSLADGRGPVAELARATFRDTPALRTKLWTRVLHGDARGARREIESPFR